MFSICQAYAVAPIKCHWKSLISVKLIGVEGDTLSISNDLAGGETDILSSPTPTKISFTPGELRPGNEEPRSRDSGLRSKDPTK